MDALYVGLRVQFRSTKCVEIHFFREPPIRLVSFTAVRYCPAPQVIREKSMRAHSILSLFVFAGVVQADVGVTPPSANLGEVRGGTVVECVFHLKNLGGQVVELIDLERSCGCVEPRWSTRSLKPGEQGTLALKIRT